MVNLGRLWGNLAIKNAIDACCYTSVKILETFSSLIDLQT